MIVAGIDPSLTCTGVAIMDRDDPSMMICASLKCPKRRPEGVDANSINAAFDGEVDIWFRGEVGKLFRKYGVTHLAVEAPIETAGHSSNHSTAVIDGAICGVAAGMQIPVLYVASASWRSALQFKFTNKRKPLTENDKVWALNVHSLFRYKRPWKQKIDEDGNPIPPKCEPAKWYKAQAVDWCRRKGIKIANTDEADAACITFHHWRQIHAAMRAPRDMFAPASGDLFRGAA